MLIVFDILLVAAVAVLLVPAAVFVGECLVAILPGRISPRTGPDDPQPTFAVLVPAHDEAAGIRETLEALKDELGAEDRVLVVADNCSDDTAEIARGCGVEVVERTNPDERGKGYALVYGLDHLEDGSPDVVIVMDADCRVERGTLAELAREAFVTDRPAQAEYLIEPPKNESARSVVSALAFLVRNRTRPRGLARLGLPVGLTGTGMAFPWLVLRNAPATGSYLVEDLLMGIELAIQGHPPLLAPHVGVISRLPETDDAAIGQRRRWEHGQLTTLLEQGPRLVKAGLSTGRVGLVAMGLDLLVPPLAFLVLLLGAASALTALFGLLVSWTSFTLALSALVAVGLSVVGAWAAHGRARISGRALVAAPLYVLWKIPIYLSFLLKKRQTSWERTDRGSGPEEEPTDSSKGPR